MEDHQQMLGIKLISVAGSDVAIGTTETLKALGVIGLAAIVGPLAIGGLLFFLNRREN